MANDNQKENCAFKDDLIAYVFAEMKEKDREMFDQHLSQCANCFEELSSFSSTRNSVRDWRDDEFAPLASNVIELPVNQSGFASSITAFLQGAVSFVALSPARMAVSAVSLALIFGIGLLYFESANVERAAIVVGDLSNNSNDEVSPAKSGGSSTNSTVPEAETYARTNNSDATLARTDDSKTEFVSGLSKPKRKSVSRSEKIKAHRLVEVSSPKTARAMKSRQTDIPQMNFETETDDGIRLTDILEEVSMR